MLACKKKGTVRGSRDKGESARTEEEEMYYKIPRGKADDHK